MLKFFQPVSCCGYGTKGTATYFDCLMIAGAQTVIGAAAPVSQCGGNKGVYGAPLTATTICCTSYLNHYFNFQVCWSMSMYLQSSLGKNFISHPCPRSILV